MADFSTRFFGGMDAQREQERLAEEELRRVSEEEQRQIERQRRNAGMNELTDRYGAVAGAPTEYGQLTGIEQRGTEFDNAQEDRGRNIQIESAQRAAAVASQLRSGGADDETIAARLAQMPDAVFGGPDNAERTRALVMSNMDDPDALLAGLSGQAGAEPEYGDADFYEVDGQEVYGRPVQQPDGTVAFEELPFQAVQPQRVDASMEQDPNGIYQRDPRTGELFLVGRAPQARSGSGAGASAASRGDDVLTQDLLRRSAVDEFNNLQSLTTEAIEKTNSISAGSLGTLLDNWFGLNQPAENLEAALAPILANEAFGQIDAMRQAAAQSGSRGTGLGQVTEREIDLLQNVREALSQSQSPAELRENLTSLQEQRRRVLAAATDEYNWFVLGVPPEGYSVGDDGQLQRGSGGQGAGQEGGAAAPQGGAQISPEIEAILAQYED